MLASEQHKQDTAQLARTLAAMEADSEYRTVMTALRTAQGHLCRMEDALERWEKYAHYIEGKQVVAPLWDNLLFDAARKAGKKALRAHDTDNKRSRAEKKGT